MVLFALELLAFSPPDPVLDPPGVEEVDAAADEDSDDDEDPDAGLRRDEDSDDGEGVDEVDELSEVADAAAGSLAPSPAAEPDRESVR